LAPRQALRRTLERRPDLLASAPLTPADYKVLAAIKEEIQTQKDAGSES
jgi:tRNA G37 N-methylase TrmD